MKPILGGDLTPGGEGFGGIAEFMGTIFKELRQLEKRIEALEGAEKRDD